ncbi:hypothetical protein TrVFT333_009035 [Trichoderma virens FT-333]|nr:hypothetical protein TrVFT333_009035 [Trichoderma virens FT-333]
MDTENTRVSHIGTLAHIRSAEWHGGDYCVVVDGMSRFTYGNLNLADGLVTTPTKPYVDVDLEESMSPLSVNQVPPPGDITTLLCPQTFEDLDRMSIQDHLRVSHWFVSEMMSHPE